MKVKTLLKTFKDVEFVLQGSTGWTILSDYIGDTYCGEASFYEDWKVISITTVVNNAVLFIKIKE